jgi:gamma-glutamyltranspeptidase/glutathione hydrolase
MLKNISLFIISVVAISCNSNKAKVETAPRITGEIAGKAMVVSAHPLATEVGVAILKQGGNAFDAAVAVQFALAVVYPRAGNIGGGGFAVYRKGDGEIGSLDFREKAPKTAFKDMYLDAEGNADPELSRIGHLAAGVPGSVDGMEVLHQKFGKLTWAELLQPSIDLAANGFLVTEDEAKTFMRFQDDFKKYNGDDFYLVKDWKAGDSVRHVDLAKTLAKIRDLGKDGFYKGEVAEQIIAEMKSGNATISQDDLDSYTSKWREPVVGNYKGAKVISMPPPSSGGIALLQLLQGSEKYDFGNDGFNSTKTVHVMTELMRRVYADRATYLGDPDFYEVPKAMLLDPTYNNERFATISLEKKTPSAEIKEGKVELIESIETTHFSIVDADRNAISLTTTINGYFGNKVMVDGAGFFLNNEMDDLSAQAGVPNQFGLIGAAANAIEPEKRMLSSMTPTIVEKDGKLLMVVGTPGGSTIITAVYQTIINVIDHKMTMQEAVNSKKIHHQWLPDVILIEKDAITADTRTGLEALGQTLNDVPSLGRLECILVNADGTLEGAADYTRGDSKAIGY